MRRRTVVETPDRPTGPVTGHEQDLPHAPLSLGRSQRAFLGPERHHILSGDAFLLGERLDAVTRPGRRPVLTGRSDLDAWARRGDQGVLEVGEPDLATVADVARVDRAGIRPHRLGGAEPTFLGPEQQAQADRCFRGARELVLQRGECRADHVRPADRRPPDRAGCGRSRSGGCRSGPGWTRRPSLLPRRHRRAAARIPPLAAFAAPPAPTGPGASARTRGGHRPAVDRALRGRPRWWLRRSGVRSR